MHQEAQDTPVPSGSSFVERAASVSLYPAERRILTQLLDIEPFVLASMTSSDLSEKSGASRSSIDRLSRKLGYAGLKEMRKALLEEARDDQSARALEEPATSTPIGIAAQTLGHLSDRIDPFLRSLSQPGLLDQLLDWFLSARSIQLFGAGESAAVCSAIYMRLVRLGLPVRFSQEQHMQVTQVALLRSGDLAIAVSFSGRSRATVWASRTAKSAGAHLVAVSSSSPSPLSRLSDLHIALPKGEGLRGSSEIHDRILSVTLGQIFFECLVAIRPELLKNSIQIDEHFGEDRI